MSTTQSPGTVVAESRVAQASSAAGWILAALALIVLLGWAFHLSTIIAVVRGLQTMKPNTAASFLLTGLALIRRRHRDSLSYSLGVFVIGALTLIEYLSSYNFGIDQLLFRDPYSAIDPGRMSLITSVGFTLLGPALAFMKAQSKRWRRISRGLALLAGVLGGIAVLGYSYDTQALYKVRPYSSVALHTAIAFVIAAIGVLCANPAEGVVRHIRADHAGGAMLRQLLPAALLIPYFIGFTAWIAHKHLGWEMGFSLALVVAATMLCLVLVMLLNAKRLERKDLGLRESEATTHALLESAAQAILAVDASGSIVDANRMAGEMFGYAPDELLGKSLDVLLPERLREQHARNRADFASNPKTRPMGIGLDLLGLRRDGSEFPIEVSLSSVQTSRSPLAVSFISDITGRKQAEAALRDSEQQLRVLAGSLLTAQEDERRRLSRELHDDVTQRLAFLSIELGKLAGEMPASFEGSRATIRTLQDQTLQASAEVRRLSRGLHPSVIEDFGLSTALEEFCGEFEKAQAVHVRFEGLVDDSRLDNASATCLYRITQESLRNAVTHGRATQISVTLSVGPGCLQLQVRDNGTGFVADSARKKTGLGIVSMKERIRLVNGTLTLSSEPGKGAEISVSVPLPGA